MKMYVLLAKTGSAASETALCETCYQKPENVGTAMEQGGQAGDVVLGHFEDYTDNQSLECIICGHPNGLWFIRTYIPVDPDNKTGMTKQEAAAEIKELHLMQPENKYTLVSIDGEQEIEY